MSVTLRGGTIADTICGTVSPVEVATVSTVKRLTSN